MDFEKLNFRLKKLVCTVKELWVCTVKELWNRFTHLRNKIKCNKRCGFKTYFRQLTV